MARSWEHLGGKLKLRYRKNDSQERFFMKIVRNQENLGNPCKTNRFQLIFGILEAILGGKIVEKSILGRPGGLSGRRGSQKCAKIATWEAKAATWRRLRASWRRLGPSWTGLGGVLGASCGVLGASWGRLRHLLWRSWGVLGPPGRLLGRLGGQDGQKPFGSISASISG